MIYPLKYFADRIKDVETNDSLMTAEKKILTKYYIQEIKKYNRENK